MQLASLEPPEFPIALGVLFCDPKEPYDKSVHVQIGEAKAESGMQDLAGLLRDGQTWVVEEDG